ncbi:hypothetical protein HaLaN_08167 [Haematococcus lacustris]|uniref:Uncharacterized protein n=1 Tax=Haematococcus lacustris TaxID=44745 RepID=A0A699Z0L4_HAELA|nr:hypothetical protein HaLaN_08167 [Haematococcus lacustris]
MPTLVEQMEKLQCDIDDVQQKLDSSSALPSDDPDRRRRYELHEQIIKLRSKKLALLRQHGTCGSDSGCDAAPTSAWCNTHETGVPSRLRCMTVCAEVIVWLHTCVHVRLQWECRVTFQSRYKQPNLELQAARESLAQLGASSGEWTKGIWGLIGDIQETCYLCGLQVAMSRRTSKLFDDCH